MGISPAVAPDQVWTLKQDGRTHRVETLGTSFHAVRWLVDDEIVAEKKEWGDKVDLTPGSTDDRDEVGRVRVRFGLLGKGRRATWWPPEEQAQAATGVGGVDLVPEPGSPAAAYEDKVRSHPTRYAAVATVGGIAKVVIPLLIGLIAVRFVVSLDWPDLPFPELPNLPDIPWPDLPDIPWPDVSLPDWIKWLLDKAKYVVPILIAYAIARAEIRRRRQQDELRRSTSAEG